jgi:hypothetical protein
MFEMLSNLFPSGDPSINLYEEMRPFALKTINLFIA